MRHDGVIFDIDGTLWDASKTSADGWNTGLKMLGIDHKISAVELRSVTGNPYETCVELLLPGLMAEHPSLLQTLNDCELAAIKSRGGDFYDGALEGIRTLSKNYKIFLVSNCQEWYLDLFLRFSNTRKILTGYDCHGASSLSKDQMIQRIMNSYHLHNPIYIGDTAGDEASAKLAGVEFIHAKWGFGGPLNVAKSIGKFPDLIEYLESTDGNFGSTKILRVRKG